MDSVGLGGFSFAICNEIEIKNEKQTPFYRCFRTYCGTSTRQFLPSKSQNQLSNHALSENGNDDIAYRLLTNKQYPSWLYSVVNGATSIWERLNSYTVENGFGGNNSMNSFNHYSFGAVAAWMYNTSLGIERHPTKTGFQEFILKPTPDPTNNITAAKGHYDGMYGTIKSAWNTEGGKTIYKITVPANSSAKLYLPAKNVNQVKETGKSIAKWKGVGVENNRVVALLGSGDYHFEVKPQKTMVTH